MELKILGSGSSGNCYIFDNGKEALVVECGISFKDVQRAVDFNVSRIVGALISHEHQDHAKHLWHFRDARIPVYMSEGTFNEVCRGRRGGFPLILHAGHETQIGGFTVLPFGTQHDAAEPLGFLIKHVEMGNVLFATDTYYLSYTFADLNNILIECNYSVNILEANIATGNLPRALRDRTVKSHCSLCTCREILLANDLSKVNNIVLIHLSDGNSNAADFQREIFDISGKNVFVAAAGMTLSFNKTPF